MSDFEGKIVKVILNSSCGVICATGPFVKITDNFLVLINTITDKLEYYSMYYIKSITIMRDTDKENSIDGE